MDGSGGRNQNAAHGSHAEFRFDAEIGGVLFEALDAILPEFGLGAMLLEIPAASIAGRPNRAHQSSEE